jgi:hypothetical protein
MYNVIIHIRTKHLKEIRYNVTKNVRTKSEVTEHLGKDMTGAGEGGNQTSIMT